MTDAMSADARPEKRLFISLLTRDIPLTAAFLDLLDNSVNAAIQRYSSRLRSADDYMAVFQDNDIIPSVKIHLNWSEDKVEIRDTASGISSQTARDYVFRFGRASERGHESDRLSVYGVGLKRAIFKLGNNVTIRSDHVDGGFDMGLERPKMGVRRQRQTVDV